MIIKTIGIDPGLANTGIGIVTGNGLKIHNYSFGHIKTSKDQTMPVRLELIYSRILSVLKKEKPQLMVVEDVFSLERYPKSGILLGKVSGIVMLAGAHAGLPVIEVPVREAKKILSGNGNATKAQLEKSVRNHLNHPEPIRPDHASDALALAMIGLFRYNSLTDDKMNLKTTK